MQGVLRVTGPNTHLAAEYTLGVVHIMSGAGLSIVRMHLIKVLPVQACHSIRPLLSKEHVLVDTSSFTGEIRSSRDLRLDATSIAIVARRFGLGSFIPACTLAQVLILWCHAVCLHVGGHLMSGGTVRGIEPLKLVIGRAILGSNVPSYHVFAKPDFFISGEVNNIFPGGTTTVVLHIAIQMETLAAVLFGATADLILFWHFIVVQYEVVDLPGFCLSICAPENMPLEQWLSVSPRATFFEVLILWILRFRSCRACVEISC